MWVWFSLCSACLLGVYDVAKKQALRRNGVLEVLFLATALSALFLSPYLSAAPVGDHLKFLLKACLVSASWVSGLSALQFLPITTASTIKASRPVIVVVFSIILFKESYNLWQWGGIALVCGALFLLSRSSKNEGIRFSGNKGIILMALSVVTGAASALFDKHILKDFDPLYLQSWGNLYITALLGLVILVKVLCTGRKAVTFHWDWVIVLVAVLITISDFLYFTSLKEEGSQLAMVSLIRRFSVPITFTLGALLFKEGNVRSKALCLGILLCGTTLLLLGSSIGQ